MYISKKILVFASILLVVFLYYLLFNTETSDVSITKKKQYQASTKKTENSSGSAKSTQSIFDSEFYHSDGIIFEENEEVYQKKIKNYKFAEQIYSKQAMEIFAQIRKKLPNNSILPRILTAQQKQEKLQKIQKLREISQKINNRQATREEAEQLFQYRKTRINDRIEIISYMMQQQKHSQNSSEVLNNLKKSIDFSKKQLQDLKQQKENYNKN